MKIKRIGTALLLAMAVLSMTACKPKYVAPGENVQPVETEKAEDAAYTLDFTEMHNEVLTNLQDTEAFGFVKDLSVDGDNDAKSVTIQVEIMEDVSEGAVGVLMSTVLHEVSVEAATQDFRFSAPTEESFGDFYNTFSVHYTITQNGETLTDTTVNAGESLPYEPADSFEYI